MSQIHALSDDQVAGELKKMTAFIRQEAMEKANEIRLKADEEFAIEKSKLVRQETASIDSSYEKKFKQAAMSQQITRSTVSNKTRLRILSARQELLDRLFEDAQKKLGDASKDKDQYQTVLKNFILEGAYAMNEDKLQLKVREADKDVATKALEDAQSEYKSKLSKDVSITIDESDPLPAESAGGVMVVGTGGRIDINNTLEERLRLLETQALPSMRVTLFGENENRRFHN
ncbi:ATPase, V1/A1 complex, subunit E [Dothidotthia symphoricarpi CBS 119687]|uniref:ATPase, V1/A1 complex, subunit E n=1 Tax=Dothidotthia symphoricarpi CBS 119687 TaxID=1392245 RepID=A0A6A6AHW7_9PLEO|nr:ATPase, V1/A1 complex, subunit E [Dothidotthia symphoricarpi CBS 119687]KAF2131156.1 ATPase, V1/A1 complex, subunit E [Dothidotthia symphoricarpi CBS 119687]